MEAIIDFSGEYDFLSNFYPSPFTDGRYTYPTVEHRYQARKALNVADMLKVIHSSTPGQAKRQGGKLQRPDWNTMRDFVMIEALCQKFIAHPDLAKRLLATEKTPIEERNKHHDIYWGICDCEMYQGMGANTLGKMLMKIREELAADNLVKFHNLLLAGEAGWHGE